MIVVHLDGEKRELETGSILGSLLPGHPTGFCVAIIRPPTQEQATTGYVTISTTAGEFTLEIEGSSAAILNSPDLAAALTLHWTDRYAAAFGPFPSGIHPSRKPHVYERGDVILGCGGYDPKTSYLIFSKSRHSADHGADETGGIIGRIVSGKAVLDRFTTGNRITKIEPVISWADTSRSFTTTDMSVVLEDGMQVVTNVKVMAQGYSPDKITTEAAGSVEHMLIALQPGKFTVGRATSTHILDPRLTGTEVSEQYQHARREGSVTVRTSGPSVGGIYMYRADVSGIPSHSITGQVVHGIEIVRLAKEHDIFSVSVQPERIDLLGLPLAQAKEITKKRGITLTIDTDTEDRIVVSQEPGTTLEILNERAVTITTSPYSKVIDIELADAAAPVSCDIFRRLTGLKHHDAGMIPAFFTFDDVWLFKPVIPKGIKINPENTPSEEVPANSLAITNDSCKGAGLVGVRLSANREFGPTSEPFEGTNIIGRVIDTAKLARVKERDMVYIREVRK